MKEAKFCLSVFCQMANKDILEKENAALIFNALASRVIDSKDVMDDTLLLSCLDTMRIIWLHSEVLNQFLYFLHNN